MCRKLCPIPRRHQQKCMEHTPPQAWPVHRSANPAVEEVEQARTGGCKRLGHNIIPVTSTTAGWGSSCGPHSAPEGSLRDSLRIRFCQLLAAPLPAGTAEGRPSAPSSGGMRRTNPPHLGRNLFRDRAGLHSLAYRLVLDLRRRARKPQRRRGGSVETAGSRGPVTASCRRLSSGRASGSSPVANRCREARSPYLM